MPSRAQRGEVIIGRKDSRTMPSLAAYFEEEEMKHTNSGAWEQSGPCPLCQQSRARRGLLRLGALRPSLADHILRQHPQLDSDSLICRKCLDRQRLAHISERLSDERGQLSAVDADVARRIAEHALISKNIGAEFETAATFGQRVADSVARTGGSWSFVIAFLSFIGMWMLINSGIDRAHPFDAYPFILLNLLLSCLAALQAPIIMMSQNRLAARDRRMADHDYQINLKSELEVAALHEKIDHLLHVQFERLVELQELQLELLGELTGPSDGPHPPHRHR
jgi:uncharacterized membrane protein